MKRSMLMISLLASVAACSSGGGSSSGGPAPSGAASVSSTTSTTSSTPPPAEAAAFEMPSAPAAGSDPNTVTASSGDVGGSYGDCYTKSNPAVCSAGAAPPTNTAEGSGASTVTLSTNSSGENFINLNIVDSGSGGISHSYDIGNGGNNANAEALANNLFFVPDGTPDSEGNTFSLIYGGSAAGADPILSWVTFGLWNAGASGNGAYGAFYAGNVTTASDMSALAAANKSATYSGTLIGQAVLNSNTYTVTGTPNMTVNFGGASPGFNGSVAASIDTGPWTTINYNGSLSGAQLAGTATAAASTITPTGGGAAQAVAAMTGPLNGSCLGPSCNNIGAIVNMSGGGNQMVGAMGLTNGAKP